MNDLAKPDAALLEKWLRRMGVKYYLCGECQGLHVSEVHSLQGVVDSRVIVENEAILFSTELELRPSLLLVLNSEMNYLAMNFQTLKAFIDVVDEDVPRLVMGDTLLAGAGVTFEQFALFFQVTLEQARTVINDCLRQGYLMVDGMTNDTPPANNRIH